MCIHIHAVFSSGGVRRWRWQRDEMAAKQPTAARIQSTAGYFQWASGTFYSHVCGDRPRFYLLFFWGGISWLYLTGYPRDRWQEMGQERGDDMQPGRSTNWGTSEPQTQVFFGKVRSLPNPYKVFFVHNQIWTSCVSTWIWKQIIMQKCFPNMNHTNVYSSFAETYNTNSFSGDRFRISMLTFANEH